jgi:hypothetical protein
MGSAATIWAAGPGVIFQRSYTPLRVILLGVLSAGWVAAWFGGWKLAGAVARGRRWWPRVIALLTRVAGTVFLLVPFVWAVETWGAEYMRSAPLTMWVALLSYPAGAALLTFCLVILLLRAESPAVAAAAVLLGLAAMAWIPFATQFPYRVTNSLELMLFAPPLPFPGAVWFYRLPSFNELQSSPSLLLPMVTFSLSVVVLVRLWVAHRRAGARIG